MCVIYDLAFIESCVVLERTNSQERTRPSPLKAGVVMKARKYVKECLDNWCLDEELHRLD